MKHSWPDRTVGLLVVGSLACGLYVPAAHGEDAPPTTVVRREVHRMGEGAAGHIVSQEKTLKKSPYPYSASSFSSRAYQDAVKARMNALRGQASGVDSTPSMDAAVAAPAKTVPPPSASTSPAVEPERPRPSIVHVVYPSGVDAELIARINDAFREIAGIDRGRSSGQFGQDEIGKLQDALNAAGALVFSPQRRPNGTKLRLFIYGVNVVMRPETFQKLSSRSLTAEEAQILARDYARLLWLRATLNSPRLQDDDRAAGQMEYNDLLSKHFALQARPPKS